MSYEFAASLQRAVYRRLAGNPELAALVGGEVHDAPVGKLGAGVSDYVTLGEERVTPYDTKTSTGAVHDFSIVAHSARDGFDTVKRIAAVVHESLMETPLELEAGHLVALRFLMARADRGPAPEKRRVALRFRAVVDQDD